MRIFHLAISILSMLSDSDVVLVNESGKNNKPRLYKCVPRTIHGVGGREAVLPLVVGRWPLAVHAPIRVRVRESFRIIRKRRCATCHRAYTPGATDAPRHVSASSLAVSETAGAKVCIIGSMKSNLGRLARGIFQYIAGAARAREST